MVYTVKVFGQTVDMCETLAEAEGVFKDVKRSGELWAVDTNGTATLIRRK